MTNIEIEKLRAENEALWKINKQSEEEIHELRQELLKRKNLEESFCKTTKQFDKQLAKTVKLERAEAIKEFAERLKENFFDLDVQFEGKRKTVPVKECIMQSNWLLHSVAIQEIDNLVKEITENNKKENDNEQNHN